MSNYNTVPNLLEAPKNDYWQSDWFIQNLAQYYLSKKDLEWALPRLQILGKRCALEVSHWAMEADRYSPVHVPYNIQGRRIDEIRYHPSYRKMEEISYGSGLINVKYDPKLRSEYANSRHMLGYLLGYIFCQSEISMYCPLCMTDGAARVIDRHGTEEMKKRVIPRLASIDRNTLQRGAMFLTEKQGGSDVGANDTKAVRDGKGWRLTGEKWFCSNVDAEVALVLARPEGAQEGTRGLGLFLLERDHPKNNREKIRIERIKDKMGVRSMPTGEVTLLDAYAEQVGELDRGFVTMAEMLNLSRLYNSVAAIGIMRRATFEAIRYAKARQAFGQALIDLQLERENLADIYMETVASTAMVYDVVHALDKADAGDEEAALHVRFFTPMVKYWTGKKVVWTASEAMEAVGGNGYIEEWVFPRLLRDAQVLPIWEGTTNILVLDCLRVLSKTNIGEKILATLMQTWKGDALESHVKDLAKTANQLLAKNTAESLPAFRAFSDKMCALWQLSLLKNLEAAPAFKGTRSQLGLIQKRFQQKYMPPTGNQAHAIAGKEWSTVWQDIG